MKKNIGGCELSSLYESCRRLAKSKGYPETIVDDFPAFAVERRIEGSESGPAILLIDFLRRTLGAKGTRTHGMKKAMLSTEAGCEAAETLMSEDESVETSLLTRELLSALSKRDAEIVRLHVLEGYTNREIGALLALTEARICQILKAALRNLKEVI